MTEEKFEPGMGRRGRGSRRDHEHRHHDDRHPYREGRRHGERRSGGRHGLLAVRLVEPALLVFLAREPQHGYTLLEALESLGLKDLHPSKVYRTLRMMEDDGWITSDWNEDETQGPPRRVYRLTAEGQDVLLYWQKHLEENQSIVQKILSHLDELPKSKNE